MATILYKKPYYYKKTKKLEREYNEVARRLDQLQQPGSS